MTEPGHAIVSLACDLEAMCSMETDSWANINFSTADIAVFKQKVVPLQIAGMRYWVLFTFKLLNKLCNSNRQAQGIHYLACGNQNALHATLLIPA